MSPWFVAPRTSHARVRATRSGSSHLALIALLALVGAGAGACSRTEPAEESETPRGSIAGMLSRAPDELPSMLNAELPFRYPASLYTQRAQGNVTLRLYVDSSGTVLADSTRVEESSGHAGLDSAALLGAQDLRFRPARRRGVPVAVSLLYPVYFRHPEAEPLPGDSILRTP